MTYDAVAFLESLFRPGADAAPTAPPADPDDLPLPDHLPADWRDLWDERAAIMEFDGGLPRELAEHRALLDVPRQMADPGVPIPRTP